jgi:hypothetical protein
MRNAGMEGAWISEGLKGCGGGEEIVICSVNPSFQVLGV